MPESSMPESDQKDFGLEAVHRPEKSALDIVFVHGLFGSRRGSWTKENILWPESLLPKDIPNARIFLFGYDAGAVKGSERDVEQTITSWSGELFNTLATERSATNTKEHPIVFVAHSLGGLVCADAFTMGDRSAEDNNTALITAKTIGMVFLGTPFRGSKWASFGDILRRVISVFKTTNPTIGDLNPSSTRLESLTQSFAEVMKRRIGEDSAPRVAFFYETKKVGLHPVVDKDASWVLGYGDHMAIEADHMNMCKFSKEDSNYRMVVEAIKKVSSPKKSSRTEGRSTTIYGNLGNQVMGDHTGDMIGRDNVHGWKIEGTPNFSGAHFK